MIGIIFKARSKCNVCMVLLTQRLLFIGSAPSARSAQARKQHHTQAVMPQALTSLVVGMLARKAHGVSPAHAVHNSISMLHMDVGNTICNLPDGRKVAGRPSAPLTTAKIIASIMKQLW
jgi:hypothetical protein